MDPSGADRRDQQLYAIVLDYLEAGERGDAPAPAAWLARHPEFARELTEFLACSDLLERLVAPLRRRRRSGPAAS